MNMNTARQFAFKKSLHAFTLVELVVVLAVIAVLAALLLPAIAATKPNSQGFQCLNNEKQITLACQMYAEDNADILPPNDYPYTTEYFGQTASVKSELKNWVVGTMEQPLDSISSSELMDPNTLLSAYVTNVAAYHCPADNYIDPFSHTTHVRSYSMNSAVGTEWYFSFQWGNGIVPIGTAVAGAWLPGNGYNGVQTAWLTYGKITSFTRPGPAHTIVLMEENPYSINDGSIAISAAAFPGATYIIDFAANNHNGECSISFADGHAVLHRWLDPRTFTPVGIIQPGLGSTASTHQTPDNPDCFYLAPITSAPR
jgi:prepilin-type N-terminal cleavage/methylation domain-containing protein/prepilin-type processing-associated H-X9-DG protein